MKKRVLLYTTVVLFMALFSWACTAKQGGKNMQTESISTHASEESGNMDNTEPGGYYLADLQEFFSNSAINDVITSDSQVLLNYSQVEERFPDSTTRIDEGGKYSVFSVREGGKFYVFWVLTISQDSSQPGSDFCVYFTAYLPTAQHLKQEAFSDLVVGESTAEDVKSIDPGMELNFNISHGVYSCSYLNQDSVMLIYYGHSSCESYETLIVQEVSVISRTDATTKQVTCYGRISPEDLP